MKKILFIGDPHLKISRFDLSCKFLKWVGEVVEVEQPDLVVNLGDTFDTHSVLRSEILAEFKRHIKQIGKVCPYFYVLGNHDFYKPTDSKYHALETFKEMSNFKVIDKPIHIKELGLSFVPYIPNIADFPMQTEQVCIAHQTFVGADYGYYRPDVGVDADKVSADIIISGHIHKRQSFGKVIYPGTPFAQGIDDINQSKGVMLFDLETFECSFIESPLSKWKGMKFEVAQDESAISIHRQIQENITTNDHWILEIVGPRAEIVAYLDSKEVITLREKYSVRFKPEYNDKEKQMKVKIRSSSMKDILVEYVDRVYQGSIDKETLKIKALEVLSKIGIS